MIGELLQSRRDALRRAVVKRLIASGSRLLVDGRPGRQVELTAIVERYLAAMSGCDAAVSIGAARLARAFGEPSLDEVEALAAIHETGQQRNEVWTRATLDLIRELHDLLSPAERRRAAEFIKSTLALRQASLPDLGRR